MLSAKSNSDVLTQLKSPNMLSKKNQVSSTDYPGVYPGEQNQWNMAKFKKVRVCVQVSMAPDVPCQGLRIDIQRITKDAIEFDLIGVDASIANAFRRILIAEVRSYFCLQSNQV